MRSRELVHLGRRIDIASVGGMPKREITNVFLLPRDLPLEDYRPDPAEVEGLAEIPIRKGLELFSARVRSLKANGIRWDPKSGRRSQVTRTVGRRNFVPKVDSYYLTLSSWPNDTWQGRGSLSPYSPTTWAFLLIVLLSHYYGLPISRYKPSAERIRLLEEGSTRARKSTTFIHACIPRIDR